MYAYSLQILKFFFKETSIWFVILVAGLGIISTRPRHSEQVCSIVLGMLFSFSETFAEGATQWRDVCGPYFLHLQGLWNCRLWLAVFTVFRSGKDSRYGFKVYRKHRIFAFVFSLLGWSGSVKRQNYVL